MRLGQPRTLQILATAPPRASSSSVQWPAVPSLMLSLLIYRRDGYRRGGWYHRHGRYGQDVRSENQRSRLEVSSSCKQRVLPDIRHLSDSTSRDRYLRCLPGQFDKNSVSREGTSELTSMPHYTLCNDDLSAFGSSMAVRHQLCR